MDRCRIIKQLNMDLMKTVFFSIIFLVSIFSISSCYYDKEELLYPATNNGPCLDSVGTISYVQRIVPLFQQNCYSCHTGNFPSGNIVMGTYLADKTIGQSGKLYGSISHSSGYSPMPKGLPKLSNCQVATIKKWIDAGMMNN